MTALRLLESPKVRETIDILMPEFGRDIDLDKVQYKHKNFHFWSTDLINRSVARSLRDDSKTEWYKENTEKATVHLDAEEKVISLPAVFNPRIIGEQSVNTMQEWECIVEEVDHDRVHALAKPLIGENLQQEMLVIPLEEFSPEDRVVLTPGTVFRFIIGWVRKPNQNRTRQATIYLRRFLPKIETAVDYLDEFLSDTPDAQAPA